MIFENNLYVKPLLFTALIFSLNSSYAQIQCSCDSIPEMDQVISCKPVIFKNKAKLYWQFTCDSSWLTFQNKDDKKTILYSLDGDLMGYTERLGYSYAAEYNSTFLIRNNVISGCCDPPEFLLFDKEKGTLRSELGRLIFYSDDPKYPVIIYLHNSNYKSFDFTKINYDYLMLLNVDQHKIYKIALPKGRIKKSLDITEEMFAEYIFETGVSDNILTLKYRYQVEAKKDTWLNAKITVDLKKYCGRNN